MLKHGRCWCLITVRIRPQTLCNTLQTNCSVARQVSFSTQFFIVPVDLVWFLYHVGKDGRFYLFFKSSFRPRRQQDWLLSSCIQDRIESLIKKQFISGYVTSNSHFARVMIRDLLCSSSSSWMISFVLQQVIRIHRYDCVMRELVFYFLSTLYSVWYCLIAYTYCSTMYFLIIRLHDVLP